MEFLPSDEEETKGDSAYDSDEDINLESDSEEEKTGGGLFSRLTSKIKNFTGNKVLTEEDLNPIMKEFADELTKKNVAHEISVKVCETVK